MTSANRAREMKKQRRARRRAGVAAKSTLPAQQLVSLASAMCEAGLAAPNRSAVVRVVREHSSRVGKRRDELLAVALMCILANGDADGVLRALAGQPVLPPLATEEA